MLYISYIPELCDSTQVPDGDYEGQSDVPLHVINNYFSIGADAQIALEFHNERGRHKRRRCLFQNEGVGVWVGVSEGGRERGRERERERDQQNMCPFTVSFFPTQKPIRRD